MGLVLVFRWWRTAVLWAGLPERCADLAISPLPCIYCVQIIHYILHDMFVINYRLLYPEQLLYQHLILHVQIIETLIDMLELLLHSHQLCID